MGFKNKQVTGWEKHHMNYGDEDKQMIYRYVHKNILVK